MHSGPSVRETIELNRAALRRHPFRVSLPLKLSEAFFKLHRFRVPLPPRIPLMEDEHVRFATLWCAVRTAVDWKSVVVDETDNHTYDWVDCVRIVDAIPEPVFVRR